MKLRTKEAMRTIKTKESALNENEYAGTRLQNMEKKMIRTAESGADRFGRWGIKQTRKDISRYRKQRAAKKAGKGRQITQKATKGMVQGSKATAKGAKVAAKGTKAAAQMTKRAVQATVKTVRAVIKAIVAAVKAAAATIKSIAAVIAAGGWIAVLVIILICIVILFASTIEDLLPAI